MFKSLEDGFTHINFLLETGNDGVGISLVLSTTSLAALQLSTEIIN